MTIFYCRYKVGIYLNYITTMYKEIWRKLLICHAFRHALVHKFRAPSVSLRNPGQIYTRGPKGRVYGWMGWIGWMEYQKFPSNFFILCGYIEHLYNYLYIDHYFNWPDLKADFFLVSNVQNMAKMSYIVTFILRAGIVFLWIS